MSQDKKPAKTRKKPIVDVDKSDDSAASATSKPVIVTHRPMLKDPMVVDNAAQSDTETDKKDDEKTDLAHSTAPILKPLAKPAPEPDQPADAPAKPEPEQEEPAPEAKAPADEAPPAPPVQKDDKQTTAKQKSDVETAEQAKREAAIQHLIDSNKYELPINAIEKRKTKRFVVLGIVLAVLLVLAWGDVAADAGLIASSGLPHSHFFNQQASRPVITGAPQATYKSFTAPVSKLTIRYPNTWQIYNRVSSNTSDNFSPQTKTNNNDFTAGVVTITFLSPASTAITGSGLFQVEDVHYQKLPHKIGGKEIYLRELIYQSKQGKTGIKSSLSNTQLTTMNQPLTTLEEYFSNGQPDGHANFVIDTVRTNNGSPGFDSVGQARQFMKSSIYKQARAILLSTAPAGQK